jgi:hypothetical protein
MLKSLVPLLGLLVPSVLILLVGFVVLRAARRRPRTVSALISVAVVAGLGAIGYAALGADADREAVCWLVVGLALVILGCPAAVLVPPAGTRTGTPVGPTGATEVAKLLFGYLAACWIFAVGLAIFVHLLTSPPGSLR